MPVYVKPIDKVEINPLFDDICDFFGFDSEVVDDYEPELSLIQYIWQSTKQVEIYTLGLPKVFPVALKTLTQLSDLPLTMLDYSMAASCRRRTMIR